MYTSTKNVKKKIFNFPSFKSFGFSSSKSNRIYIPDKPVSSELFKKYIHSWIPKTHWLIVLVRKFCRKKMLKGIDYLVSTSARAMLPANSVNPHIIIHLFFFVSSTVRQNKIQIRPKFRDFQRILHHSNRLVSLKLYFSSLLQQAPH